MLPVASRTRNPIPRSSSKSSGASSPVARMLDRYQTHARLWSGETRVTSAGSMVPVTRTSPAARDEIRDVAVSPIQAPDRYPASPRPSRTSPPAMPRAAIATRAAVSEVTGRGASMTGIACLTGPAGPRRRSAGRRSR